MDKPADPATPFSEVYQAFYDDLARRSASPNRRPTNGDLTLPLADPAWTGMILITYSSQALSAASFGLWRDR